MVSNSTGLGAMIRIPDPDPCNLPVLQIRARPPGELKPLDIPPVRAAAFHRGKQPRIHLARPGTVVQRRVQALLPPLRAL